MLKELILQLIKDRLGNLKPSPSGWECQNCPVCIHRGHSYDTRNRFGLKVDGDGTFVVHCFNCGLNARYSPGKLLSDKLCTFLKQLGVSDSDIKKLKFEAFREKESGKTFARPKLTGDPTSKWAAYGLPEDSYPIMTWLEMGLEEPDFITVAEYCLNRKVKLEDALWSPCKEHFINKRFIMPFYYRGNVVGYAGRFCADTLENKANNRYYGHTPANFVYNLDAQVPEHPFVIVCEGVLDAYLVKGVATLGAINTEQAEIINSLRKRVIVCPDRDEDGMPLVQAAIDNGWEVAFPKWESHVKDVGKAVQCYGKILTLQSIIKSAITDPTKILLKRKMDNYVKK